MKTLAERWTEKTLQEYKIITSQNSNNSHSHRRQFKKKHVAFEPTTLFQKQEDFCLTHTIFNGWRGICPCSLDDCLFTKVLDANGDVEKLKGFDIGQGITTDQVIDEWLGSGEPLAVLFDKPAWLICMAEYLWSS